MSTHAVIPPGPFRDRLCSYLAPYFVQSCPGFKQIQAEILETLASYGARTRSELINAARIIALSFSSLELLGQAKATAEMPPSVRLKYIAAGNSLARVCHQQEVALAKRLKCDVPQATSAEPVDDISLEETDAALSQAQARIDKCRNRLYGARPATGAQATPPAGSEPRPWGSAMMKGLAEQAMAANTAT